MVYSGTPEEKVAAESMEMGSDRAKPLHNFNLTWDLKWGNQRQLRCMKVSSDAGGSGGEGSGVDRRSSGKGLESSAAMMTTRRRETEFERSRRFRASRPARIDAEEGIEAVREKLMFDLKVETDKMKDAILREGAAASVAAGGTDVAEEDEDVEMAEVGESSPAAAADVRPWNLRTRRAACKAPIIGGGSAAGGGARGLRIEENKANYSPMRGEANNGVNSARLIRGASGSGSGSGSGQKDKEKERPKFSVSLTKKEIEDDFMAMLGHRPPRRPKRRPKNVQKQIDTLFPGMWLSEVSAENYKVPEFPETAKR